MRITTRLRIISTVTIAALVSLTPVLIWSFVEFRSAKSDYVLTDAIHDNFFERASFRDQYFLYREDRARALWEKNNETADNLLRQATVQFQDEKDQHILGHLRKNIEDTAVIFHRIVKNTEVLKTASGNRQVYEELDKRLYSQLLLKATAVRDTATALQNMSAQRVEHAYQRLVIIVGLFAVMLALVTILNSMQIHRLIRKRLAPLHAGAKIVADGGLYYRIKSDGSDEFAELALSINAMTDKLAAEISERKRAEQTLTDSERFMRTLADNIPGMVGYWTDELRSGFANIGYLEWFGKSPEQMRGIHIRDLMGDELFRKNEPFIRAALRGESQNFERSMTKSDGSVGYTWAHYIPDYDGERVRGFFVMVNDITELKKAEIELRDAKERAEAATKLKDQFVSLVAHDLRSPFTAMLGLLKLFMQRKSPFANGEDKKLLDAVFTSGDRMMTMIDQLLKISRFQTGQIRPQSRFFKGHMAVAVTIGSINHTAAQKGIVIINDVPLDMRLYADQSLFDEVLLNLLSNAIKFCSKGDKITFFAPPGLEGAIAIRDTGKGIDEENISNLFRHEVKTTTSGTAGELGTGLGLPFSYDIMKAHGGDITVESAPGKGSVFTATLPFVKPVALVVDYDPAALTLARIQLEKIGIEVICASDGEKALVALKDKRPHIIITDIMMPGIDGFTLLDRLKKDSATRDIPVIVMTAMESETRENAFRHGADDFVSKPIAVEEFIPRVRRFVG